MTTIQIKHADLPTWRRWCKAKSMTSAELINAIMRHATLARQAELYKTLPSRDDYKRPLSGCKIDKKKITIGI